MAYESVDRGINLFPSAIAAVIAGIPLLTGEFELVVDSSDLLLNLALRVESVYPLDQAEAESVETTMNARFRDVLARGFHRSTAGLAC